MSTIDAFGRPLVTTFSLRDTTETRSDYSVHGPCTFVGEDTASTTLEYYDAGWLKKVSEAGLSLVRELDYDELGNVVEDDLTGGDCVEPLTMSYDAQGRPLTSENLLGPTSLAYEETSYGTEVTVTRPDGTTSTHEYYKDGSPKSASGDAVVEKVSYQYGVTNGLYYEQRYVTANPSEWQKAFYDPAGRMCKTARNVTNGLTVGYTFGSHGLLTAVEDEEGISAVQDYDAKARVVRSGRDVNGDGDLEHADNDRFVSIARTVSANDITVTTHVHPDDGSSASNVIAITVASLDGKRVTTVREGRTNIMARGDYTGAGAYIVTNSFSDGTKTVETHAKWLLTQVEAYDTNGAPGETVNCYYDGLGALTSRVSSSSGTNSITLDACRRVKEITQADPGKLPLSFEYRPRTRVVTDERRANGELIDYVVADNGLREKQHGGDSYSLSLSQDSMGRRTTLGTERDGTTVETEWGRDGNTGWINYKEIAGTTVQSYTYRANGQISSYVDGGVTCKLFYADAGDLWRIVPGGSDPDIVYTNYDRGSRPRTVTCGGATHTFAYTPGGLLTNAASSGGPEPGCTISRVYATNHFGLISARKVINYETNALSVTYDEWTRVSRLAEEGLTVDYGYKGDLGFVDSTAVAENGTTGVVASAIWDATNGRMDSVSWDVSTGTVASFTYEYASGNDRLDKATLLDGTYWNYTYDNRNHLESAQRFKADDTPYPGRSFIYRYDSIGNLIKAGFVVGGQAAHSFENNNFNFQVARTWSNKVLLVGTAAVGDNGEVTVNDIRCERDGDIFSCILTVDNSSGSIETNIQIIAVSNDVVASAEGTLFVAAATGSASYDTRGALTNESRRINTFDNLGRLTSVVLTNTSDDAVPCKVEHSYDFASRRVEKIVYADHGSGWTSTYTHAFVYDGWNVIHEKITCHTGAADTVKTRDYLWGLDLVGQRNGALGQGAGGIGALLSITVVESGVTNTYFPFGDRNGHIVGLVDADTQEVVAEYEYSPFGVLIGSAGDAKDECPFLFNSKYYDSEAETYYFGFRHYDPATGKWMNRDPFGEGGGVNLTAFCRNDPVNRIDPLGAKSDVLTYFTLQRWFRGRGWEFTFYNEDLDDLMSHQSILRWTYGNEEDRVRFGWTIEHQIYTFGRKDGQVGYDFTGIKLPFDLPFLGNKLFCYEGEYFGGPGEWRQDKMTIKLETYVRLTKRLHIAASINFEMIGRSEGDTAQNVVHWLITNDKISIPYVDKRKFGVGVEVSVTYDIVSTDRFKVSANVGAVSSMVSPDEAYWSISAAYTMPMPLFSEGWDLTLSAQYGAGIYSDIDETIAPAYSTDWRVNYGYGATVSGENGWLFGLYFMPNAYGTDQTHYGVALGHSW